MMTRIIAYCIVHCRFEATPPSVHAMIGLCVIGSLTLDLTLLQTALLETHKIIGIDPAH